MPPRNVREFSAFLQYSTAWPADHTPSEAEAWLQGVEDTENLVAELDLVFVVTLRQVLYLQHIICIVIIYVPLI
jgi:hypothetical protein